jgi:hypothetical protein
VTSSASLENGLPPNLSGGATPFTVCQQASEAIISFTTAYQTRYSLACLPPLLPYMVFAAVLHQLSLSTRPLYHAHHQGGLVGSPEPLSPGPIHSPLYSVSSATPRAGGSSATAGHMGYGPEPSSPPLTIQAPGSAGRRNSALSASSTCFFSDEQIRRLSVGSFASSTSASDSIDGPSSPPKGTGSVSDTLPIFASQPVDVVTIGSLQLVSMGAQHPGAAEAAYLLRTMSVTADTAGISSHSAPGSTMDSQSGLPVGLGLQLIPGHGANYEIASADTTPGPASVPRFQPSALSQQTNSPPKAFISTAGRAIARPLS